MNMNEYVDHIVLRGENEALLKALLWAVRYIEREGNAPALWSPDDRAMTAACVLIGYVEGSGETP
jgi:hypothetical protein